MAINLQKGQRINIERSNGEQLTRFCIGVSWGSIEYETKEGGFLGFGKKTVIKNKSVDIDLSCVMYDKEGNLTDYIYSTLYRPELLSQFGLNSGKLASRNGALRHTGDDKKGDMPEDDGMDNETISVDLTAIGDDVQRIFFFLNSVSTEDFSQIPYANIRIYEGTPAQIDNVFAEYNVSAEPMFRSKKALILCELYRKGGKWRFNAIGDAYQDVFLGQTIQRISQNYARLKTS